MYWKYNTGKDKLNGFISIPFTSDRLLFQVLLSEFLQMRAEFFNNFDQNSVCKAAGISYYFYFKIFVIKMYWKYNTAKNKLLNGFISIPFTPDRFLFQ